MDSGLINIALFRFSENKGKILENIVFNHLKQTNKEKIFYWKNKHEIDFVVRKGYKITNLYNICWALKDKQTIEREINSLIVAKNELKSKNTFLVFYEKRENVGDKSLLHIIDLLFSN